MLPMSVLKDMETGMFGLQCLTAWCIGKKFKKFCVNYSKKKREDAVVERVGTWACIMHVNLYRQVALLPLQQFINEERKNGKESAVDVYVRDIKNFTTLSRL